MDAREQLRRYLEQRRELGETELVLDTLTVDETLRILGAPAGDGCAECADASAAPTGRASLELRTPAIARDGPATPRALVARRSERDWRAMLRARRTAGRRRRADRGRRSHRRARQPRRRRDSSPERRPIAGDSRWISTLDAIAKHIAACTRCPLTPRRRTPCRARAIRTRTSCASAKRPARRRTRRDARSSARRASCSPRFSGAIDLRREDVFICNVLKHRPPGNRNPRPDEVTACSPYLVRQIELVQPKVILALGTFAAQTLLDTKLSIGKLRGQVHRYTGCP